MALERDPIGCLMFSLLGLIFLIIWAVDGCSSGCNPKEAPKVSTPKKA